MIGTMEELLVALTATEARACAGGYLARAIALRADGGGHDMLRPPPLPYPPVPVGPNPPLPPVIVPLL